MSEPDRTIEALVEIPKGSRNKYEYDEKSGRIRLDRVLYSSVHYPTDYGFILNTLSPDGDHLDILVITHEPTFPGCLLEARPIGGLDMSDEKGIDFKILAVPASDPRWEHTHSLSDLEPHWLREIKTFFSTYKELEPKETEVHGWEDVTDAWAEIERCQERYRAAHQEK